MTIVIELTCISAMFVDVECFFSRGRLLLSHIWNSLSVQSTCTSLSLGAWSRIGLVRDDDVMGAARLPEVKGTEAELIDEDWDKIL